MMPEPVAYNIEGLKTLLKEGQVEIMTNTSLKEVTGDGIIVKSCDRQSTLRESDRLRRRGL